MKKTITKSYYGSCCIPKGYCENCKNTVFIIDKHYTCCGQPFIDNAVKEKKQRVCNTEYTRSYITKKIKFEVLQEQDNRCIYCDMLLSNNAWNNKTCKYTKLQIHYDHFEPWIYSGNNNKYNLYASCHICNLIKSDKHFINLISAREYINEKRKTKGYM